MTCWSSAGVSMLPWRPQASLECFRHFIWRCHPAFCWKSCCCCRCGANLKKYSHHDPKSTLDKPQTDFETACKNHRLLNVSLFVDFAHEWVQICGFVGFEVVTGQTTGIYITQMKASGVWFLLWMLLCFPAAWPYLGLFKTQRHASHMAHCRDLLPAQICIEVFDMKRMFVLVAMEKPCNSLPQGNCRTLGPKCLLRNVQRKSRKQSGNTKNHGWHLNYLMGCVCVWSLGSVDIIVFAAESQQRDRICLHTPFSALCFIFRVTIEQGLKTKKIVTPKCDNRRGFERIKNGSFSRDIICEWSIIS